MCEGFPLQEMIDCFVSDKGAMAASPHSVARIALRMVRRWEKHEYSRIKICSNFLLYTVFNRIWISSVFYCTIWQKICVSLTTVYICMQHQYLDAMNWQRCTKEMSQTYCHTYCTFCITTDYRSIHYVLKQHSSGGIVIVINDFMLLKLKVYCKRTHRCVTSYVTVWVQYLFFS